MNVVLLNLYHGGHHGQHLLELVRFWPRVPTDGTLHLVVTEAFVQQHPDVAAAADAPRVRLHRVAPFAPPRSLAAWDLRHGLEARRWASRLDADHLVFMYLDHAQLSLSTFLRGGKTRYSGIHFRPSFHYHTLGSPAHTRRERLGRLRKAWTVKAMLANPNLHTLFELDEYAVPAIRRLAPRRDAAVHLPEPLTLPQGEGRRPALLGAVEPGRKVLVLFGALDERKGLLLALDALDRLRPEEQGRLALVLAGKLVNPALRPRIHAFGRSSHVQLVFEDRFLDEAEIQPLLAAADLNLVPYVGHIGSSGILVRTAAAGKAILATDYGVVGEHVRRYGLGRAVDTWTVEPLAAALSAWLQGPSSIPFDRERAAAFVQTNTAEAFAQTLFERLGLSAA